jgi:AP endonuclease 1
MFLILFQHGGLDAVKKEDPDIFCCQETKCDITKIPIKAGLPGYHSYWLSGDKQGKKTQAFYQTPLAKAFIFITGYSGVGLLSRIKPIKVTYGIEENKFDNEGRVITAEYEDYYVINSCKMFIHQY